MISHSGESAVDKPPDPLEWGAWVGRGRGCAREFFAAVLQATPDRNAANQPSGAIAPKPPRQEKYTPN